MHGIFAYIYHQNQPFMYVGKYTTTYGCYGNDNGGFVALWATNI